MTKDEALKLALEALETVRHKIDSYQVNVCDDVDEAITVIREALAQPEQEPVAVARVDDLERGGRVRALAMNLSLDAPLYTAPPHRKPLSDEEITGNWLKVMWAVGDRNKLPIPEFARAIEAAHGIKGEA